MGIQEEVKPIISKNLKVLGAYLSRDTHNGRRGYAPEIIQKVFTAIEGRDDFNAIGLEDMRYLEKIWIKPESKENKELENEIDRGIKIITKKDYVPIGESAFIAAYITQEDGAIKDSQMLDYLDSDLEERSKIDEAYIVNVTIS